MRVHHTEVKTLTAHPAIRSVFRKRVLGDYFEALLTSAPYGLTQDGVHVDSDTDHAILEEMLRYPGVATSEPSPLSPDKESPFAAL